jgi:hypothetical protein
MMIDEMVHLNKYDEKIKEVRNYFDETTGLITGHNLEWFIEELEAAARYIEENEVIHKKVKKDIPTVIEYQGRRYILDHANHYK